MDLLQCRSYAVYKLKKHCVVKKVISGSGSCQLFSYRIKNSKTGSDLLSQLATPSRLYIINAPAASTSDDSVSRSQKDRAKHCGVPLDAGSTSGDPLHIFVSR